MMPQIIPIKELKNTSEISDMCHKIDEPIYEASMRRLNMYRDIEISEQQIEVGKVKEARLSLKETRAKYGL